MTFHDLLEVSFRNLRKNKLRAALTVAGVVIAGGQISLVVSTVGTLTNNVGRYLLLNVPAGEQTIRAEFIGYGSIERSVQVPAGGSVVR